MVADTSADRLQASALRAARSSHATSTIATEHGSEAGDLALRPGETVPRDPRLRRQGRSLRLRSRCDPRRGAAARCRGELKLAFNLELVLQGIDRSAACDEVWLAVRSSGRRGRERDPRVRKLCRLLGFGLLGVSTSGRVELLLEPAPWRPRRDAKRRSRLVDE